jgi:hypothetical protein
MSMPVTKGVKESTPCPWPGCGFKLDFTEVPLMEPGALVSCDRCKRMIDVISVKPMTVVTLQCSNKTGRGFQTR